TITQVSHLASQGHTEIFYTARASQSLSILSELRKQTGAEVAASLGLTWIPLPEYVDTKDLVQILDRPMAEHPNATAVAGYNDTDALATIFALHSLQVPMPERMAVIGIDNDSYGSLSYPTLTTVAFNFEPTEIRSDHFLTALENGGTVGVV